MNFGSNQNLKSLDLQILDLRGQYPRVSPMASLVYFGFCKLLVLYLALFVLISMLLCASIESHEHQTNRFGGRRRLLELEEEDDQLLLKKKNSSLSAKNNQTKLIKSSKLFTKNQSKLTNSKLNSTNNQTKLSKPINSTKATTLSSTFSKSKLKQLNSTSMSKKLNSTSKAKNSPKTTSVTSQKTSDLLKRSPPKNKKTTKNTSIITPEDKKLSLDAESSKPGKNSNKEKNPTAMKPKQQKEQPSWIDQEYDSDLVAEFRDLPTKFQQTLIPDLEKISTNSKAYITKYNKQIMKQFKPYVGNNSAPTIASIYSCAFLLIPLLLVSLIFNRIKAYFSLQKVLIFIQVYLSIYFSILAFTCLVTGLEPLKFFYATSPSIYVCLQVVQTLGYVFYLLLLLMYLILVFSTQSGLGSKMLGLGQTFVGFTVGLHYYVTVFHRMVLRQPPKTSWKVHGMYATCFLVICLCARADGRKKAYLKEGGEDGKKN